MKIVYVTPFGTSYENVHSHTTARIRHWSESGHPSKQLVYGSPVRRQLTALQNLVLDFGSIPSLAYRVWRLKPDIICVRWARPTPLMVTVLARIAPVVLDIHASDISELGTSRMRINFIKLVRRRELRAAKAACFVTDGLRTHPDFEEAPLLRGVFTNGTSLARRQSAPLLDKPIVGMSVGNTDARQGLDRLRRLAENTKGVAFRVACAPKIEPEVRAQVGPKVLTVPCPDRDSYTAELSGWTVAIGTMALDRTDHRTAASLKVRDYVGLGIPTVLPYIDEGLNGIDDPYVLQLADAGNRYARVSSSTLEAFAYDANGHNVHYETSSAASLKDIEDRRLLFFAEVLAKCTCSGQGS